MNILNVEKVSKTYGEKELFNNISLGINSGDKIGLIGVNGTGKSTLLKIIAGVEEPDEGQVVKGRGLSLRILHRHLCIMRMKMYWNMLCVESMRTASQKQKRFLTSLE